MLKANGLWFRYGRRLPWVIENQTLAIAPGERVALVAPSGRGKTTLSKLLAGYLQPQQGQIRLDDRPLPSQGYCPIQLIFQHPELAINPRWRIDQSLNEAPRPSPEILAALGIQPGWLQRYPHELSGGELQRLAIARVLTPATRYLIADEMTAMLDANTQALIWQVVLEFAQEHGVGLVVISHSEALLGRICERAIALGG
ncbi:MAG: ATP-binding cassette domain-containing protein [Synechococcales cyanobacterium RM1_1_8]|nr:ATP-binding cassette domain-containing protein [Synechococcales cyanobacterium RM1_1_8]